MTTAAAHRNGHAPTAKPQARPQPVHAWARGVLGVASIMGDDAARWYTPPPDTTPPADVLAVARLADERLAKLALTYAAASDLIGASAIDAALGGTHRAPVDLIAATADALAARACPPNDSAASGRRGMIAEHLADVLRKLDDSIAERADRDPSLIVVRDLPADALAVEMADTLGVTLNRLRQPRLISVDLRRLPEAHPLRDLPITFDRGEHRHALLGVIGNDFVFLPQRPASAARPVYTLEGARTITAVYQRARLFKREEAAAGGADLAEIAQVREALAEWQRVYVPPAEAPPPLIVPPQDWRERSELALGALANFSTLCNRILRAPPPEAPLGDLIMVRTALVGAAEEQSETCYADAARRFAGRLAARHGDLRGVLTPFLRSVARALEHHTQAAVEALVQAHWKQEQTA